MWHRILVAFLVAAAVVSLSKTSYREGISRATSTSQPAPVIDASSKHRSRGRQKIPPLSDLVDLSAQRVKSNVEFLLDFAIVGYPKTGTSFLLDWLAQHDQVLASTREMHDLSEGRLADFVSTLYNLPPHNEASQSSSESSEKNGTSILLDTGYYKRGYKAPRDVQSPEVMRILDRYWPDARLVVGLRHPVLWFESYYNFRVRKGYKMAPADSPAFLDQNCSSALGGTHGVCAEGSQYHVHLSRLGKTPMTSRQELALLGMDRSDSREDMTTLADVPPRSRRRIFLYEISQLHEGSSGGGNATPSRDGSDDRGSSQGASRAERFRLDLSRFLGLDRPLYNTYSEPNQYLPNRTRALRICDPRYAELRWHLMKNARSASAWIREYLLSGRAAVTVSSPAHFHSLLRGWMSDPCVEHR
jgi:hypothetical protein